MAKLPTIESVPSARRLVESLRDVGYDFPSAVADLIDNSVAASATRIDVQCHWNEQDSWVRISDNGNGMNAATLTEALRFGAETGYQPDDLGKFGLGLKTASLSQCREITVASRVDRSSKRIEARRFSLDRILQDDRWEIESVPARFRSHELVDPLEKGPGTTVLWTQLDRMLSTGIPRGAHAKNSWYRLLEQLERHLGMVFHRFIEGDLHHVRRKPIKITVNGNVVEPWNPFAPSEPSTMRLPRLELSITGAGHAGLVMYEPFVLPAKERFTDEEEFKRLSGPNNWNQQQGFYIYRANRMIQSGGWNRMRTPDEHTKLARVALDFFPELDDAFGINISKASVQLPSSLRDQLKQPIEQLIKQAKKAYNPKTGVKPKKKKGSEQPPSPPDLGPREKPKLPGKPSAGAGTSGGGSLPWPPPPLAPPSSRIAAALQSAAEKTGTTEQLTAIKGQVQTDDSETARAIGW